MPGEGVSRANPTVLLWQPPQTGLGLRTEAGWGMAGRWAKTALRYSHPEDKQSPGRSPSTGCSSTVARTLGLPLRASDLPLLTHNPRSKSQGDSCPLPRLFRSTAFLSLPPVSKTQPPNPESYFPTLRKEGMPTHRKASVAQSHPGRKPRWEAAGHLLVEEETISWAPWTRPTLGCISHQPAHYQPCCNCSANPTTGLALPPGSHSAAEVGGGGQESGLESFSPFGDHRAIASLVTSLCFRFLGTNRDRTTFSTKLRSGAS